VASGGISADRRPQILYRATVEALLTSPTEEYGVEKADIQYALHYIMPLPFCTRDSGIGARALAKSLQSPTA